jgi:hypothetical protein
MPSQNGVRRHDGYDAGEELAAQAMSQFPKTPPLAVIQPESLTRKACLQHAVLFAKERDRVNAVRAAATRLASPQ